MMSTFVGLFAHQPALFALDKETRREIQRLDQRISGYADNIQQIMRNMRSIERKVESIQKDFQATKEASTTASDLTQRLLNKDIANLVSTDKQLAQRLNALTKHIEEQTGTWNWGSRSRKCEDVGEHQQIQTVRSSDDQYSLRYLCYDGRAIHLGTEVNLPPQ